MGKSAAKNSPQIEIPFGKVLASPTKKFFVEMLTRDIDLMDAIMDLIDNCIDGVHRHKKRTSEIQNFYQGYFAEIRIDESTFEIKDNCGGIPKDVAERYAFKMGREDAYDLDKNLETVGVYGIGMKRAIFKMGLEAEVLSHHHNDTFKVKIPENWTSQDGWFFDFENVNKGELIGVLNVPGTKLSITKLHPNIASKFKDKSVFIKDLQEKLQQHYGYIINQGFKILLNGITIKSLELNILTSIDTGSKKTINPYVYSSAIDGVSIEVIIGFYRPPADSKEIEDELDGGFARSTSDNAGITILCNDRIVLFSNKDYTTGWGDHPVPSYHTQFINIAGVVHFRSDTPIKLPVTTTKRGVDSSSPIFTSTRNRIKEGLKLFTAFTNHWKSHSEERANLFKATTKINALQPGQTKSPVFTLSQKKRNDTGQYQLPDLPQPNEEAKDKFVTISFSREKTKVQEIKEYFLNGELKSASEIGGWCFDEIYSQVD